MEVSRGPVPDPETQGLGVRQCRIPRHFPMNGSGSGSTFISVFANVGETLPDIWSDKV